MGTPLADKIREQARKSSTAGASAQGATAAMTKQAQVSSTGKAAPTGGMAGSSIAASVATEQAQAQEGVIQEGLKNATTVNLDLERFVRSFGFDSLWDFQKALKEATEPKRKTKKRVRK